MSGFLAIIILNLPLLIDLFCSQSITATKQDLATGISEEKPMNLSTQFSQAFVQVSLATATILLTNNCYQKESLTLQIVAISAIPEIQSEAPQPPPPPRPFGKSHRFFSVGVHKSRFLSQ